MSRLFLSVDKTLMISECCTAVIYLAGNSSEYEWRLSPVSNGGREYLLDMETNFVYIQPRPTEWVKVRGSAALDGCC
jgi:hypothetical protein